MDITVGRGLHELDEGILEILDLVRPFSQSIKKGGNSFHLVSGLCGRDIAVFTVYSGEIEQNGIGRLRFSYETVQGVVFGDILGQDRHLGL